MPKHAIAFKQRCISIADLPAINRIATDLNRIRADLLGDRVGQQTNHNKKTGKQPRSGNRKIRR